MPWDPSYDHFCVLCWPLFPNIEYFDVCGGYMKVYKAIWSYMKVYGGIWRYMKVYKHIYIHTFSTLFFFNFRRV